ncbi:MAG: hypothetical protein JSS27_00765 [Planctomycetes bacterium]|nr:hypothetical protein [Planctomycetota bacterium]
MRKSWKLCVLAVVSSLFGAAIVQAEGFLERPFRAFKRDAQRNNAWPEAFIPSDRARVRAPMQLCIENGYRFQNTLGDDYFEPDTGRLKEAGMNKVYTILTESQMQYRCIYVVTAESPELTAARIMSVQQAADKMVAPGELAQVAETRVKPRATPAFYVDAIDRAWRESRPAPTLPPATGRGSSSGGASAAGS